MSYYTKAKDVFLQRRTAAGKFEEYGLIVQSGSVVVTDANNNLIMTSISDFLSGIGTEQVTGSITVENAFAYARMLGSINADPTFTNAWTYWTTNETGSWNANGVSDMLHVPGNTGSLISDPILSGSAIESVVIVGQVNFFNTGSLTIELIRSSSNVSASYDVCDSFVWDYRSNYSELYYPFFVASTYAYASGSTFYTGSYYLKITPTEDADVSLYYAAVFPLIKSQQGQIILRDSGLSNRIALSSNHDMSVLGGMESLTLGEDNISIGRNSIDNLSIGYNNIAIGEDSLKTAITARGNVAIGQSAGNTCNYQKQNLNQCVFIGKDTNVITLVETIDTPISNSVALGFSASISQSNEIVLGNDQLLTARPGGDNYTDLGDPTHRWKNLYVANLNITPVTSSTSYYTVVNMTASYASTASYFIGSGSIQIFNGNIYANYYPAINADPNFTASWGIWTTDRIGSWDWNGDGNMSHVTGSTGSLYSDSIISSYGGFLIEADFNSFTSEYVNILIVDSSSLISASFETSSLVIYDNFTWKCNANYTASDYSYPFFAITSIYNNYSGSNVVVMITPSENTDISLNTFKIIPFNRSLDGQLILTSNGGSDRIAYGNGGDSNVDISFLGGLSTLISGSGSNNLSVGNNSLSYLTIGRNNVAVGTNALSTFIIGDANVAVGTNAGYTNDIQKQNIYGCTFIGDSTGVPTDYDNINNLISNSVAIGSGSLITQSNEIVLGNTEVYRIRPGGNNYCQLGDPAHKWNNLWTSNISGSMTIDVTGRIINTGSVSVTNTNVYPAQSTAFLNANPNFTSSWDYWSTDTSGSWNWSSSYVMYHEIGYAGTLYSDSFTSSYDGFLVSATNDWFTTGSLTIQIVDAASLIVYDTFEWNYKSNQLAVYSQFMTVTNPDYIYSGSVLFINIIPTEPTDIGLAEIKLLGLSKSSQGQFILACEGKEIKLAFNGTKDVFIASGYSSLMSGSGGRNLSIGDRSLRNLTMGEYNVAIGDNALSIAPVGSYNTSIGASSGGTYDFQKQNMGSCTFVGCNTQLVTTVESVNYPVQNSTALGYGATISESNEVTLGNSSIVVVRPDSDNYSDLGNATHRWKNIYGTASYATLAKTASFATTASYSVVTYITQSQFQESSSYASSSLSSSYALTASYIGEGVDNYVPKWSSNTLHSASIIYDNSAGVGIGTTTIPTLAKLMVNGNISGSQTGYFNSAVTNTDSYFNSVRVGRGAGNISTNTAVGLSALYANSVGSSNTAIGNWALFSNASNNNTAIGYATLYNNWNGSSNTAIGGASLYANIGGINNTAVGMNSLLANGTGNDNTAIGLAALLSSVSGSYNVAVGSLTGYGITTSSWNIFIGYLAGSGSAFNNTTNMCLIGSGYDTTYNVKVGIGVIAPPTNTLHITGSNPLRVEGLTTLSTGSLLVVDEQGVVYKTSLNIQGLTSSYASSSISASYAVTASYFGAGTNNYIPKWNNNTLTATSSIYDDNITVGIGTAALLPSYRLMVNGSISASADSYINGIMIGKGGGNSSTNLAIGPYLTSNTTGDYLIAIGKNSMTTNTTGTSNIAIGYDSLTTNATGNYNIAIGHLALTSNNAGKDNVGIGYRTLTSTLGDANIGIGSNALRVNVDGTGNIAIGAETLILIPDGYYNTAIGNQAGSWTRTGSYNIFIGANAGSPSAFSNVDNVCLIGDEVGSSYAINVGIGVSIAPTNVLHVVATSNPLRLEGLTSLATGSILVVDEQGVVYKSTQGATSSYALTASYLSTSGSNNYVPKWNNNTLTTTSSIYDNNSGISIGFNSPSLTDKLTVSGSISASADSYFNGIKVGRGSGNLGSNTAIGSRTLDFNISGYNNTAVGYASLPSNDGDGNTAIGASSLYQNTSGDNNTAIGEGALLFNHGSNNTAIGLRSGVELINGDKNIFIGYFAGRNVIFNNINNICLIGGSGSNAVNVGIGVTSPPTATLQVEGNISASSITASLVGNSYQVTGSIFNYQTFTYTLTNADNGRVVSINSGSTANLNISASLNPTFNCMVYQSGSGQVNFVSESGVNIRNRSGYYKTAGQYAIATLLRANSGDFILAGDLTI